MSTYTPVRAGGRARCRATITTAVLVLIPAWSSAQSTDGVSVFRPGQGPGLHALVGGFVGRLDLHGAGDTELFGARVGAGYGEVVQLTGFYWRGFDRSADTITADYSWGGELQLNLNTGTGVTPFVTGGAARVNRGDIPAQNAAIAGAGLNLPLGPVLLHAAARDYMFGVSGLTDENSPEEVTHNWLYSAGITLALGRRRGRAASVVAAPPQPERRVAVQADPATLEAERAELRAAAAELQAVRDSLRAAGADVPLTAGTLAQVAALDTVRRAPTSYHSAERIEIPIPTHGSITLRYGPETAAAAPVIVTGSATASTSGLAQESLYRRDPLATTTPLVPPSPVPPPPGTSLADPATQQWLQQVVATQVAQQLALRPADSNALTPDQLDAVVQRVMDGVMASVVPRLDAVQVQRMNQLRDELRLALAAQRDQIAGDVLRLQSGFAAQPAPAPAPAQAPSLAPAPAAAATPPAAAVTPPAPAPIGEQATVRPPPGAEPRQGAGVLAGNGTAAAARTAFAAVASGYPSLLTAAETERGPAAVLGDAAFATGAALVNDAAREAVNAVADVLRRHPARRVYVHGHTDAVGEELSNQRLSELRAEAVRSLLVQAGVEPERIFVVGYGEARPVADNGSPRGRALNRRVEVIIGDSRAALAGAGAER